MTAPPNPLIAQRHDTTRGWTGIGIADDIQQIVEGYRSGSWIDESIGGFAASMDALGFITDPLATVVTWGSAWLMEHFPPLRRALDWLAGDPPQITAYAQTWRNVAEATTAAITDISQAVARDVAQWTGAASDAYREHVAKQHDLLEAAAEAADAIAEVVEGAGLLVAIVREMVRDLIAEFVGFLAVRWWEWAAEEGVTLGIATPWVAAQVSALVAKWVAKISKLLKGLLDCWRRLAPIIHRLHEMAHLINELIQQLKKTRDPGESDKPGSSGEPPRPVKGPAGTKPIRAPNDRHKLNSITGTSPSKARNTVILPGTDVGQDLDDIRSGRADWNSAANRYEVNGRSYGVEANGTVYPISGPGFVNLSRAAYKVLKQCITSDGDVNAAREALRRDPSVTEEDWRAALAVFRYHKQYRGGE